MDHTGLLLYLKTVQLFFPLLFLSLLSCPSLLLLALTKYISETILFENQLILEKDRPPLYQNFTEMALHYGFRAGFKDESKIIKQMYF